MNRHPKRSNAPIFWSMFGGGGMLSALFGPILIVLTGLAVPLGWIPAKLLEPAAMRAAAGHWFVALVMFVGISLFAWHAAHRLFKTLHDLGFGHGLAPRLLCYGSAAVITAATAACLLAIR